MPLHLFENLRTMLNQAFATTLKILLFRAGPEDFPYSDDPALSRVCSALGVVACAILLGMTAPPLMALGAGVVATIALSLFIRMTLRLRRLDSRYQQTRNAMLASGAALMLAMSLPMAAMLPVMKEILESVKTAQQAAEAGGKPLALDLDKLPLRPMLPGFLVDLLLVWLIAVTAHVLRRATGTGFFVGGVLALLCMFNVALLVVFTSPLLALMFG